MADVLQQFLVSLGFMVDSNSKSAAINSANDVEKAVSGADRRMTDAQNVGSAKRLLQSNREAGIRTKGAAAIIGDMKRSQEADAILTKAHAANSKERERADGDAARAWQARSTSFITGLTAITAAAAYAATKAGTALVNITSNMDSLYKTGQRTSSSVGGLKAFGYAAEQLGSSAEEAIGFVENLARLMKTSPGWEKQINDLGIKTRDDKGNMLELVKVSEELESFLSKVPDHQQRAYASVWGMSEKLLLAITNKKFKSKIAEKNSMMKAAGLDPEQVGKDSEDFMAAWSKMRSGLEIVAEKTAGILIKKFGGNVDAFTKWLIGNAESISTGVSRIGDAALRIVGRISDLAEAFGKLSPGTKDFIVQMGVMGGALLLIRSGPLGAIIALATGIVTLYDDFQKWREGSKDTLIDWAKWEPPIREALKTIREMWEGFDTLTQKLTGQSGLTVAFGVLAAMLVTRVLAPLTSVVSLLTGLGGLALPAWMLALLGVSAAAANANGILGTGEAGQGLGERALRTLDPGLGDRVYGQSAADQAAAKKDGRSLWQRYAPKILGGQDAQDGGGRDIRPTSKDIHPEMAAYIRSAAEKRGIDPKTAIGIADGEGLGGSTPNRLTPGDYRNGVPTSFGPFQLHRGGNGSVGSEYEKATGNKVDDPAHWQGQVDFALDWAKKKGWGAWYGRSKHGIGLREGLDYAPRVAGSQTPGDTPSTNGVGGVDQRQSGVRNQPITDALRTQIEAAAKAAGVNAEIYSGGQDESGPNRTGSHRHDNGQSADLKLYTHDAAGKRRYLSMNSDLDRGVMEAFIRNSVKAGANGVGAGPGYMGEHGIHVGGGSPSAWGAGGSSANAPDWVRRAHQNGMLERSRANTAPAIGKAIEAIPKIEGALQRFDDGLGKALGNSSSLNMPQGAPLGSLSTSNISRTNTITTGDTHIKIDGARDPKAVGAEVGKTQTRVHADLLRNMQGAIA